VAVQADHLIQQQLGGQRIAPDQERAQRLLDDEHLRRLDRAEQARDIGVGQNLEVGGADAPWLTAGRLLARGLVELGVQVERLGLAVAGWKGRPGPRATHLEEANIRDLHSASLRIHRYSQWLERRPHAGFSTIFQYESFRITFPSRNSQ